MIDANTLHYAKSTGALHASVMYAETTLRIALENPNNSPARLRARMGTVLAEMRTALFEQASREAAVICPERRA
jgi:hypothetical protein